MPGRGKFYHQSSLWFWAVQLLRTANSTCPLGTFTSHHTHQIIFTMAYFLFYIFCPYHERASWLWFPPRPNVPSPPLDHCNLFLVNVFWRLSYSSFYYMFFSQGRADPKCQPKKLSIQSWHCLTFSCHFIDDSTFAGFLCWLLLLLTSMFYLHVRKIYL